MEIFIFILKEKHLNLYTRRNNIHIEYMDSDSDIDITKTLTINEITKICSNKILVDPYGAVAPFQWHLFQLHEI